MIFENRRDAGRKLAGLLTHVEPENPIVLALPRGGVPVAAEVARLLGAPMDLLAVRKLGAPQNPEFGIGAVAEDGTAVMDTTTARQIGVTQKEFERILERESRELRRRMELFRDGLPPADLHGRTVIVVDDGMATGLTDLAAVRAVQKRGARRIVVAVPVASQQAVEMLRTAADEVVCHTIPRRFVGVGGGYRDFSEVFDDEVLAAIAERPPAAPEVTSHPPAEELVIDADGLRLRADLSIPPDAQGLVIFAHGSGSSRLSPRNRAVARHLSGAGLATLLLDLLAPDEEGRRDLVFDIPFLAARLEAVTRWAGEQPATRGLPIGYFGASTGGGAALWAAASLGTGVAAVVSRGGRPDLAAERLPGVTAATLLIVGSRDPDVRTLNLRSAERLRCPHRVEVVEGAGHLFEEPGALEAVARLASDWFLAHLPQGSRPSPARLEGEGP